MKPATLFHNGLPGLLGQTLACACVLSLGSAPIALAEGLLVQKTFKLHATVVEKTQAWTGARNSNHDPFWSHDGIGEGENIALSEDKKGSTAQESAVGSGADTQKKDPGVGSDKEKSETPPAATKSEAVEPNSTDPATKTETPAAPKGSVSTAPPAGQGSQPGGRRLEGSAVDWSHWANELADRWYQNLIVLERKSGKGFNTLRPAKIRFTCYPDGSIKYISVFRSCGIPEYDRMQIEALKQTQPLAGFPAGTKKKSIRMLQGWESRKRLPGEKDFELGSYGKKMPVERARGRKKSPAAGPAPAPSAPKSGASKPTAPKSTATKSTAPKSGAPKSSAPKPGAGKPRA